MDPDNIPELQAMKLGDFGYAALQLAAREAIQSGNISRYIAAVEKWEAEK